MLYLEKYHDISISTIYNDLHGYIEYQDFHGGGYTQYYAGVARMQTGNYEMAVEHFTKALNLKFSPAMTHCFRATAYGELKQYDKGINDYNATLEISPDACEVYYRRGLLYLSKKEPDMALEDLTRSIKLDPQQAQVFLWRGWIYHAFNNNMKRALKDYDESIRLDPNNGDAYNHRAVLYYEMSNLERRTEYSIRSIEDFLNASKNHPSMNFGRPKGLKATINEYLAQLAQNK